MVWPVLMRFASNRALFGLCGIMATVAICTELFLGSIHADADAVIWTNSFVQFETFAAGAMFAILLRGTAPRFNPKARLSLAAVSVCMWFASAYWFRAKNVGPASSGPSLVIGYLLIASGCATAMLSALGIACAIPSTDLSGSHFLRTICLPPLGDTDCSSNRNANFRCIRLVRAHMRSGSVTSTHDRHGGAIISLSRNALLTPERAVRGDCVPPYLMTARLRSAGRTA
jgi:hypothetical protein